MAKRLCTFTLKAITQGIKEHFSARLLNLSREKGHAT